jgi:mycofactocin system glycosyltransferase
MSDADGESDGRTESAERRDGVGIDATGVPDADRDAAEPSGAGRYRLWDDVSLWRGVLVSRRPLTATRLNDAAVRVVRTLDDERFRRPATVADRLGVDRTAVATVLERLHRRGLLAWAPDCDPTFEPPVSVVVTVRNAAADLGDCLDALSGLAYPRYEVLVVDDGSTDDTVEIARSHRLASGGDLRVVEVGTDGDPLGIGASRNHGVAEAAHDVIAFTDADCRPDPGWLRELVPRLAAHDVVGGRVRPHGDPAVAANAYEGVNSSLDMGAHAARVDPDGATPYLPTADLVGRREAFESVPFPEQNVAEDVTFCWRALDAGFDVVYAADGVVEHDYRRDPAAFVSRRATYAASEALLARRFGRGDGVPLAPSGLVAFALAFVALVTALAGDPLALGPRSVGSGGLALAAFVVCGAPALAGAIRRYRRLPAVVTAGDVAASAGRGALSSVYATAREVTRYYSGPAAAVGVGLAAVGSLAQSAVLTGAGTATLLTVAVAVALPALIEYAVHRPPTTLRAYCLWYLLDHAGYQVGAYRGARRHRTLAHLAPWRRVRLTGALGRLVGRR